MGNAQISRMQMFEKRTHKKQKLKGVGTHALLVCAVGMGFASCGKVDTYDFTSSPALVGQGELKKGRNSFAPPLQPDVKVDMLFVVDNSGSMSEEQAILADSFSQFIHQFVQKDVDFHIGVITTDVTNPGNSTYWNSKLSKFASPDMGCLLTRMKGERYLTSTSANLVSKFRDNVKVGTQGSGQEQGLHSISQALSSSRLAAGGCNEGFLREDALLWTGVISDENEDIRNGETPQLRVNRITTLLNHLKAGSARGWKADFIVDLQTSAPKNPLTYPLTGSNGFNPYPEVYLAAAASMPGRKINIHQNFANDLVSVGSDIIRQAESEFKLTHVPVAGTLVVRLDGNVLTPGDADGYIYHSNRNTIELKGAALLQSPGRQIVVDYLYL